MRFLVTDTTSLDQLKRQGLLGEQVPSFDIIVSWNTFADSSSGGSSRVIHLGESLHDQEEFLQRALLDWLGQLAARHTADDSPLPFVYPNLHAWWLLTVTEKNYATTPELTTLAKLILLHDLCARNGVTHIEYRGSDRALEAVLCDFAHSNGWPTTARRAPLGRRLRRRTETLQAIAHFTRALTRALTASLTDRHRMRSVMKPDVALVGYLIPAVGTARGQSPYWGNLPDHLATTKRVLWLFHRSDEMPLRTARQHCVAADTIHSTRQHRVIDDFISPSVVCKSITSYLSWRATRHMSLDEPTRRIEGRTIPVGELFADHLSDSLSGSRAVSTLLHSHAYEHLASRFREVTWLYLWENKPFEHALTSAVNRHSSGKTVGYAHSVVRRRDHRYFEETSSGALAESQHRPSATIYAVNGELPLRHLRAIGIPRSDVVEVEALRYSLLEATGNTTASRILVVGDISAHESRRLLDLAGTAISDENCRLPKWFKPHPGSPHHAEIAEAAGFMVTGDSLADLAPTLALAIVGSAGAASIDLTMLGVPVATVLDPATMNLSPLLGVPGACFVRSISELREFIKNPRLHQLQVESIMHRSNPPERWLSLLDGLS